MLHYFDYAATTPVLPEVAETVYRTLTESFGNPSSRYPLGQEAAARVKADRAAVAAALGCEPMEVIFTSCGTEGNNWAIRAAVELNRRKGKHIVTTALEHSAVLEPIRELEAQGYEVTRLQPDKTGHISMDDVRAALRPDTVLVSMMLVNNELGVVLPVAETAKAIKAAGCPALLHCDAVQGFLKVPFTPKSLGMDFLSISGHKIGAPKGIGALYVNQKLLSKNPDAQAHKIKGLLLGGGQEGKLRSGTEPTAQIAGFAEACRIGKAAAAENREKVAAVKERTLAALKDALPELEVISFGDAPHICAVTLPGYKAENIVRVLGDAGVCISSGSACHKGKPSHVFAALGLPRPWLDGTLRISFSPAVTDEDIDALVSALVHARDTLFQTMS